MPMHVEGRRHWAVILTIAFLPLWVGVFKQYLLTLSVTMYFGVTIILETYTWGTLAWVQLHVKEFSTEVV